MCLCLRIPAVYGIHLKQCVTLYLFLLPLCLVGDMSWKMVGFVTSFAFILVGIEGIAAEIEKPFGYVFCHHFSLLVCTKSPLDTTEAIYPSISYVPKFAMKWSIS